jgi:beta-lactamase superfamily II metal-dependent hydrolase
LRYIKHNGVKILYSGDLETAGWDWLIKNNESFTSTISEGVDILIAPHHGHNSGFPSALFEKTGNVKCVIHSKGSESTIEGTDVSNQYSQHTDGIAFKNLTNKSMYRGKILTTRSNGNIYIRINKSTFDVWTTKAASRHEKIN